MSLARLLLAVGLLAALAAPEVLAKTAFTLEAHDSYFVLEGETVKNPVLAVRPGEPVALTLIQKGVQPHNWVVEGLAGARAPASGALDADDEDATAQFTAPEAGEYPYHCTVHPPTMRGILKVGEGGGDAGTRSSPGVAWLGALVGAAVAGALARRR